MKKDREKRKTFDDLRRRAEERLTEQESPNYFVEGKDPLALVHELTVHQIELEMQNEELRRANQESEELRQRFQDLFDFAPMGYVILDEKDSIVSINLSASILLQHDRSMLMGRRLSEFFVPSSSRVLSLFYRKVRDSEKSEHCELRLIEDLKVGKWLIATGSKITWGYDGLHFLLISFADITERKEIEASLIASEEKFSKIFDAVQTMIGIITADTCRFIDINSYCTDILGYRSDEIIGRTADELGLFVTTGTFAEIKDTLNKEGFVKNAELTLRVKNDGIITVLLSADFVLIKGVRHIIIVMRDITERKMAEEEIRSLNSRLEVKAAMLDEANRDLDSFNYAVAHDLLNYLNGVSCYCQLVKQTGSENMSKECLEYVESMYKSILKMEDFIETMLQFARLSHCALNKRELNLSTMAQEIALGLKFLASSREIKLQIAEGVMVNGEPSLLRIILENLFGNAFKFTDKKKLAKIEFGVTEKEGEAVYFVRDNGMGFDISLGNKIFTPFQRIAETSVLKGYGIGLATVERIVRRHGGRIWAESEAGKGATFFFTLGKSVT